MTDTATLLAENERVLVTGAQGFVGRYLINEWLEADPSASIAGVGRSPGQRSSFSHKLSWGSTSLRAPLPDLMQASLGAERYVYHEVDMCDRAALTRLLQEFNPTTVVHLAKKARKREVVFRYDVAFADGTVVGFNSRNGDRDEVEFARRLASGAVGTELLDDALRGFVALAEEHGFIPLVTYTPDTDYSGQDSFEYTVSDGQGNEITCVVWINVRSGEMVVITTGSTSPGEGSLPMAARVSD